VVYLTSLPNDGGVA